MPITKLYDRECPNEKPATLHIQQTGRYKRISIMKICLPNMMYKIKLHNTNESYLLQPYKVSVMYMKFTELLM
jgi:hypothetical protein